MDHTRSCRGSEDDQPRAESSNHLRTTTSSWGSFAVGILDPRLHGASSPQKPQVNSTPQCNNRSGSRCSSPAVASYAAKISSPNLLMCNLLILGLLLAFHDSVLHPVQASSSSTSSPQQLRVVDQERDSRTIQQSGRRHEIRWSRSLHLQQLPPASISPVTELLDTASMHNFRRGAPSMRVLLQSNTSSSSTKNFRPLAAKSDRVDPLNHLRKYRDGFDLKNKHYWAVRMCRSSPHPSLCLCLCLCLCLSLSLESRQLHYKSRDWEMVHVGGDDGSRWSSQVSTDMQSRLRGQSWVWFCRSLHVANVFVRAVVVPKTRDLLPFTGFLASLSASSLLLPCTISHPPPRSARNWIFFMPDVKDHQKHRHLLVLDQT